MISDQRPQMLSRPAVRARIGCVLLGLGLTVAGIAMLAPVAWVFVNSLEPESQQFTLPPVWWPHPFTLTSYSQLFHDIPFLLQLGNSVLISAAVVIGSTTVSVLAA